jgi:hypothetical protein
MNARAKIDVPALETELKEDFASVLITSARTVIDYITILLIEENATEKWSLNSMPVKLKKTTKKL